MPIFDRALGFLQKKLLQDFLLQFIEEKGYNMAYSLLLREIIKKKLFLEELSKKSFQNRIKIISFKR